MRKSILYFGSLLVVASMLLAACGTAATEAPAEGPAAPAEQPTAAPQEPAASPTKPTRDALLEGGDRRSEPEGRVVVSSALAKTQKT